MKYYKLYKTYEKNYQDVYKTMISPNRFTPDNIATSCAQIEDRDKALFQPNLMDGVNLVTNKLFKLAAFDKDRKVYI